MNERPSSPDDMDLRANIIMNAREVDFSRGRQKM